MLIKSLRSSIIVLVFFCYSSVLVAHQYHPLKSYEQYDTTPSYAKKKSDASSFLGICTAAACIAGALVLGGIGLYELCKISDEQFFHDGESRYYAIKHHYTPVLYSHISNDDLEEHIISHFIRSTYRVLSFKRQLESDIDQLKKDAQGVDQRIKGLKKKLQSYDQEATFNYSLACSLKRKLENLHDQQRMLLDSLRALLVRVVRLPRCYKEEREKRKDDQERERIHALHNPHVCLHAPIGGCGCHHAHSSVSIVV